MKLSREVKTAILVISGILFLIIGINYLKGKNIFQPQNEFYTEFEYNALTTASPVTIKGNNVGKINSIKYDFESGKTRVSFTVDKGLKFTKNSIIRLYELGIMGGNGIAIIPSTEGELAKSGDFIKSEVEEGLVKSLTNNFSGLSSGLDGTLESADSLLVSLNRIVEDDSEKGLKNAIGELNETIKSFKSLSYSFNSLISKNDKSLTAVISNFNKVSEDLAVLSTDLKDVEISKTVKTLDQTLLNVNTLLADLDNGDGTLGKLLKDDKLYDNLEVASQQLRELLQDFKLNPGRYVKVSVFGKKNNEEYVKPEDERQ
ncbi:MlaD family protein [Oceanihabitans sediminis]|uniref:MCE family protein n=1 Tax=Oceanihabitans sediminis TaxID=1812012 RepID=A0A368P6D8_9FLAO|nr:MlaD family protein [Oceanihabitans sediminis]MDX1278751.1 MlaD family protein [Oceanihabitans sediminis]MDX1773698.1 MlaD family protein [Oceanihabitans sediminis]RBP33143.1 phospholipid/cholesterol/gamma-HCH transport system substrate-binding protein [Oceanihabitans sediminis]RCU57349.1 MCE family protein [Oceanihabitans sediminis]